MLEYDRKAISSELSHQPHLPGFDRLDRCPDLSGDPDAVPPNDASAGERVAAETVYDRAFDRPVELSEIGSGDRPRCCNRPAERAAGDLFPAGPLQSRQKAIE